MKLIAINPMSILKVEIDAIDSKTKEALDKGSELSVNPPPSRVLKLVSIIPIPF
ncbi:hypothetical protein Gorai_001769 [Gossypium raimondii]|uniref:Uncharacterized protein n=1 Tax=Gossypium raimondii TaxID=29730 RepID=A0A7J8PHF0_GOSRA|nr:hypothetical protein [Gossypium raimondii]